jgi:hypothetical protein
MKDLKVFTLFHRDYYGRFEYLGTFDSDLKAYEVISADFDNNISIDLIQQTPREEIRTDKGVYVITQTNINDHVITGIAE